MLKSPAGSWYGQGTSGSFRPKSGELWNNVETCVACAGQQPRPPSAESTRRRPPPNTAAMVDRAGLLRQLEYYFSDLAFPYDTFLQGEADEHGTVPAAVLAGSPKVVSMTADLSPAERASLLLELASESDSVKVVGDAGLARVWPLPLADPAGPRSVYMSGVPKAADEASLRSMLETSSSAALFAPVVAIRRLRDVQRDRNFSGQIFIELEDGPKAAALLKAANSGSAGVPCNKVRRRLARLAPILGWRACPPSS